jgi:hypothetical protein
VDVPATAATVDSDGSACLWWPKTQETLSTQSQPNGWPLVGPALDDGKSNDLVVEVLCGGKVRYFEHHLKETDCRRHLLFFAEPFVTAWDCGLVHCLGLLPCRVTA